MCLTVGHMFIGPTVIFSYFVNNEQYSAEKNVARLYAGQKVWPRAVYVRRARFVLQLSKKPLVNRKPGTIMLHVCTGIPSNERGAPSKIN